MGQRGSHGINKDTCITWNHSYPHSPTFFSQNKQVQNGQMSLPRGGSVVKMKLCVKMCHMNIDQVLRIFLNELQLQI